jgi:hypothetical protein
MVGYKNGSYSSEQFLPDQPVGEYPDVPCASSAAAFDALDSLCQELEALKKANAELLQENIALAAERDKALYERDTARTTGSFWRGW